MLYREGRVTQVPKAEMVQMAFPDILEIMALLETKDLKDHLVLKVVLQLLKAALNAHHTVTPKATKVVPVHQETVASPVAQGGQAPLVNLVDAFLVNQEHLDEMVDQVMMEPMADLVNQVSLEDLEMLLASGRVPVQISSLA